MRARHLVVDLGGVLFGFDHGRRLDRLAALFALPRERLDEVLWRSGFSADCDSGRYEDAARVRAEIRARTGFGGSDDELDRGWCSAFLPCHDVAAVLRRYGGPRTLFTNNGPLEEATLPRLHPGVFEGFDGLVFSHRLGDRKPSPAAFAAFTRLVGVPPGDVLFVDDSAANVEAARAHGWTAVRYESLAALERVLGI
jgi:putative hydrolase of the HAD superfamily